MFKKYMLNFLFLILITIPDYNNQARSSKSLISIEVEEENPLEKLKTKFTKDWERKLVDFNPEYYYTFDIFGKKRLTFYEEVDNVPVEIQGAYLTSNQDKVYFFVKQDNGGIVFHETANESVFKFKITRKGLYVFVFDNRYSDHSLTINFTMGTQQNQILTSNQLENTHMKIKKLDSFMKSVYIDQEFMKSKFKERVKGK